MSVYIRMLTEGMLKKGHTIEVWNPKARFYKLPVPKFFKKWLGYIDQFIVFPLEVKSMLKRNESQVFVFADNALGPWVPLVSNRPHVIHCHDFIAYDSITDDINKLSFTGKLYQKFILKGLQSGKNFISVSMATRKKLESLLISKPVLSEVVYNGINDFFKPADVPAARLKLSRKFGIDLKNGYIMHVGGNLWYKNRKGVIEIYIEWRTVAKVGLPLILIGEPADNEINRLIESSKFSEDIHILNGIDDETIHEFYAGASLFLFPSIKEGFGWPIAEAMACGCPVITTDEAPMNETGGAAAIYIPKRPAEERELKLWCKDASIVMENIFSLSFNDKKIIVDKGFSNIGRFDLNSNLDKIEDIYMRVLTGTKVCAE